MIKYDRLWKTMKDRGVSQYDMYTYHNIPRSQLDRFRKNKNIEIYTIDKICNILNCNIEDVVEHVPDSKDSDADISFNEADDKNEEDNLTN